MATLNRLSDAERGYYQRVEGIMDSEDFDEDDSEIFMSNFLDQVLKDGIKLVFNDVVGSRVLQKVLKKCRIDREKATVVLERIVEHFDDICAHRYGSHVLETFLVETFLAQSDLQRKVEIRGLEDCLLTTCSLTLDKISTHISCPYASHILRCILQVMSGLHLSDDILRSKMSAQFCSRKMLSNEPAKHSSSYVIDRREVSDGRKRCLERFGKKLCKLKPLEEYVVDPNASPVLQAAVIVLGEVAPERGGKLVKKIFKCIERCREEEEAVAPETNEEGGSKLSLIFFDPVGSHMIDVLLEVIPPELHESLYTNHIQKHVMELALHPIGNFVLQHFIVTASEAEISMVMDELSLEDVISVGHLGVIVKLSYVCVEMVPLQRRLWSTLLAALHAEEQPKRCLPLLLSLRAYKDHYQTAGHGEMEKEVNPVPATLHGSLLVQNLLQYQDTKRVTSLVVGLPLPSLTRLACHPNGSHVLETLLSSKMVDSRKKKKMVEKLKGTFSQLCQHKHGSHLVDTCWKYSEIVTKREIAEELLAHEEELKSDYYGKFVLRNCNIENFKRKQGKWQEKQKEAERTTALFDDILKGEMHSKKTVRLPKKRSSLVEPDKMTDDDDPFTEKEGNPHSKRLPLF